MKRRHVIIPAAAVIATAFLNVLAWNSVEFCDWYIKNIFPIWGETYGRLMSRASISVGEIMIVLALILVAMAIVLGLVAVIFASIRVCARHRRRVTGEQDLAGSDIRCRRRDAGEQDLAGSRYMRFYGAYIRGLICIVSVVCLVMTLNCYMLYHSSTFEQRYLEEYLIGDHEYTVEELGQLRDFVVTRANEYSKLVERDENGLIVYDGDMGATAIEAMKSLSEDYPELGGFYTTPKPFAASEFFSQQYMKGYYFPFSMEANYNDVMYIVSKPATMCHELSHTKGFIREDEANMISFLACVHSDDPLFVYSGYMSVLNYIDNDFKKSIGNDMSTYNQHVRIRKRVKLDNVFLTDDAWEKVEQKAVISTETVKKASHTFVETNLKANGVEQGAAVYCEVVGLLMDYYVCGVDELVSRDIYLASQEE